MPLHHNVLSPPPNPLEGLKIYNWYRVPFFLMRKIVPGSHRRKPHSKYTAFFISGQHFYQLVASKALYHNDKMTWKHFPLSPGPSYYVKLNLWKIKTFVFHEHVMLFYCVNDIQVDLHAMSVIIALWWWFCPCRVGGAVWFHTAWWLHTPPPMRKYIIDIIIKNEAYFNVLKQGSTLFECNIFFTNNQIMS